MAGTNGRELLEAVNANRFEAVRAILAANRDVSLINKMHCLHWAITFGKEEMTDLLLDSGADVHTYGRGGKETPLVIAIKGGQSSIARKLLQRGADPNKGTEKADGDTPLIAASRNIVMVKLLLEYEPNVNQSNEKGTTALLRAVDNSSLDIATVLLKAGADVNIADNIGYTPLIMATERGLDSMVSLLLSYGADIEMCAPSGRSVYEIATKESIRRLLSNHRPSKLNLKEKGDTVVAPSAPIIIPAGDSDGNSNGNGNAHRGKRSSWKVFGSFFHPNSSATAAATPEPMSVLEHVQTQQKRKAAESYNAKMSAAVATSSATIASPPTAGSTSGLKAECQRDDGDVSAVATLINGEQEVATAVAAPAGAAYPTAYVATSVEMRGTEENTSAATATATATALPAGAGSGTSGSFVAIPRPMNIGNSSSNSSQRAMINIHTLEQRVTQLETTVQQQQAEIHRLLQMLSSLTKIQLAQTTAPAVTEQLSSIREVKFP